MTAATWAGLQNADIVASGIAEHASHVRVDRGPQKDRGAMDVYRARELARLIGARRATVRRSDGQRLSDPILADDVYGERSRHRLVEPLLEDFERDRSASDDGSHAVIVMVLEVRSEGAFWKTFALIDSC